MSKSSPSESLSPGLSADIPEPNHSWNSGFSLCWCSFSFKSLKLVNQLEKVIHRNRIINIIKRQLKVLFLEASNTNYMIIKSINLWFRKGYSPKYQETIKRYDKYYADKVKLTSYPPTNHRIGTHTNMQ